MQEMRNLSILFIRFAGLNCYGHRVAGELMSDLIVFFLENWKQLLQHELSKPEKLNIYLFLFIVYTRSFCGHRVPERSYS